MELIKFASWPEVMAHAKAGRPLYYQAPMRVLRAEYYQSVRGMVEDLKRAIKDGEITK